MKPSIMASFDTSIPFQLAVPMIRKAGFRNISLGGNLRHAGYVSPEDRSVLKQIIDSAGLQIDALHAPFPEGDRLLDLDEKKRRDSVEKCRRAVDAAQYMGAGAVALHLMPYGLTTFDFPGRRDLNRMVDRGIESVRELAGRARSRGVKLALENGKHRNYDRVLDLFLEEFKNEGDAVGFCYDSGHEHLKGTCFEMLEKHSHRLICMHIHDNFGETDLHLPPYEGSIDWESFKAVLRSMDYSGSLLMEVSTANSAYKDPVEFLAESWKRAGVLLEGRV